MTFVAYRRQIVAIAGADRFYVTAAIDGSKRPFAEDVRVLPTTATAPGQTAAECMRPAGVQRIVFDAAKYPSVRRHFRRAVLRRGWPRQLVVNRGGATSDARDVARDPDA